MRKGPFIVNEAQPFGKVINQPMMSADPIKAPIMHKELGALTNRFNHAAYDVTGVKTHDFSAGAYERACKHSDNPFAWTGHPKK